jgi:WD40 repeat protein
MPFQKTKVDNMRTVLHLPDGKRIINHSWDGSFRVWDLETDTQDGEEWEDKDQGVRNIALSPDGKKIASGSRDGTVKLWNIDTGKVIKTLTGYTKEVCSVNWSPDGGRVVSGSDDGTFRVWDVQSGKTILGPINVGDDYNVLAVKAVCYSPDAKMIATGARWNGGPDVKIIATAGLKIWDANSGELFKTFKGRFWCLAWTLDGKTLIAGRLKIDTATWTVLTLCKNYANAISLSPNNRILATTSFFGKTAQLWNLETNKPIGTPLHHQGNVTSATFSADGKFLVTDCLNDREIYTWDVSSIIKKADLSSNIVSIDILHFLGQ